MTDKPDESVEDVIEKVGRAAGRGRPDRAGPDGWSLPEFFRRPHVDVRKKSYHIGELVRFSGRAFVSVAYQALLKREPDPEGEDAYIRFLWDNPDRKAAVLAALRCSGEGEVQAVEVRGLRWQLFWTRFRRIPVLGRLPGLFGRVLDPFGTKNRIARLEDRVEDAIDETGRAMEWTAMRVQRGLDAKADASDLESKAGLRDMDRYLLQVGRVLDRVTALMGNGAPGPGHWPPGGPGPDDLYAVLAEEMYVEFENAFRGPSGAVRRRMAVYLPLVREAVGRVSPGDGGAVRGCAVLDLGCGRGEFLELLSKDGIPAAGVDSNRYMAERCREAGLDVRRVDIFTFMEALPDECLAAISAFQVLEHLGIQDQIRLINQARRILAPGGLIVLETPNPLNLLAGAVDFHRDPTHLRPVHPDTLVFMARYAGFARARACFMKESGDGGVRLEDAAGREFRDLQDYIDVSRDYALIAYKGQNG